MDPQAYSGDVPPSTFQASRRMSCHDGNCFREKARPLTASHPAHTAKAVLNIPLAAAACIETCAAVSLKYRIYGRFRLCIVGVHSSDVYIVPHPPAAKDVSPAQASRPALTKTAKEISPLVSMLPSSPTNITVPSCSAMSTRPTADPAQHVSGI